PVVHRVREPHPAAMAREPLRRSGESLGITVERHQFQPWVGRKQRVRMTAEADGRVDEHGGPAGQSRGEQLENPLEKHGNVLGHDYPLSFLPTTVPSHATT